MNLKITNIFFVGAPKRPPFWFLSKSEGKFIIWTFYVHLESVFVFLIFVHKAPKICFFRFFGEKKNMTDKKALMKDKQIDVTTQRLIFLNCLQKKVKHNDHFLRRPKS